MSGGGSEGSGTDAATVDFDKASSNAVAGDLTLDGMALANGAYVTTARNFATLPIIDVGGADMTGVTFAGVLLAELAKAKG